MGTRQKRVFSLFTYSLVHFAGNYSVRALSEENIPEDNSSRKLLIEGGVFSTCKPYKEARAPALS